MALLDVKELSVHFGDEKAPFKAVDRISYQVNQGEVLGIVGESGSGKSVSSLAVMGLIDFPGRVSATGLEFEGKDLLSLPPKEKRELVGADIAMIFQDPMTSLNPAYTVGFQIMEAIKAHQGGSKKERRERTLELLRLVGIPDPESRIDVYPHQLSGGMRQRVMIAMAVSCEPRLLIADEPTTALDVTIQAQILELMCELREKMGTAIMLITHDMGVVAETADDVLVLYAGKAVEYGSIEDIFERPKHPYTQGLLNSIPRLDEDVELLNTIEGTVPAPDAMPAGCRFAPRCPYGKDRCMKEKPGVYHAGNSLVSCFRYEGEKE